MGKKPTPEENAGRLAKKAAAIIDENGWSKGYLQKSDGSVCIRGAMSKVAPHGKTKALTYDHEVEADIITKWFVENVSCSSHEFYPSIQSFNDGIFESKEEVIAWLLKCGDALDRKK